MNWNDYEAVWKRQTPPVGADADVSGLRETFETKRRKQATTLLVRDWAELLACGFVVFVYIKFWQKVGPAGWPMGFAILIILLVAAVFIRERLRSRRNRLGADSTLRAKVEADLAELHHQRRLILRVWAWYIAPCAIAMAIHGSVILRWVRPGDPLRKPVSFAVVGLSIALLCWFVWVINHRAVRTRIEPRIAELEKLRRDLLPSE